MQSGKYPRKPDPVACKRSSHVDTEKSNLLAAAAVGAAQEAAHSRGQKLKGTTQVTTTMENESETFATLTGRLREMAQKRAEEDSCCDCFFVGFFRCCPCIDNLCDKCTDCCD